MFLFNEQMIAVKIYLCIFYCTEIGGGVVIPKEGYIVNGKCQEVGSVASEAFNLTLRVCTIVWKLPN